jgi:ornithine cyclodeaminase
MKVRILSAQDVRRALPMSEAIDAMRSAFAEHARGKTQAPLRTSLQTEMGVSLFMPAYLPESGALAQKIVSVFPRNSARGLPVINGLVIVLDQDTGEARALLEGGALTAIRTGAASGLATEFLARPASRTLALIGAGGQAYDQVRGVRAVRAIAEVRIVSKSRVSAERLAQRLREEDIDARAMSTREAVQGADIITTVTDSVTPVFLDADVGPGVHINLVGAYTRDMQEAPASTIMRARVFVDDVLAAAHEAGDIIKPIRANLYSTNDLAGTLGQLVLGEIAGRRSDDEITIFKSVGLAVQDAAAAIRAVERAEREGLGQVLELA